MPTCSIVRALERAGVAIAAVIARRGRWGWGVTMTFMTTCELWIRSTDIDSDNIVNNARYFEFFQEGRVQHLQRLGVLDRPRRPGAGERTFTIAETSCRYRAPLRYGHAITLRTWTREIRNRSFILEYEIVRGDDESPIADGWSAQVWLDDEGRPAPLPGDVREMLARGLPG